MPPVQETYRQKLLPRDGEDKAAYLARINAALAERSTDKKDKALLLASKAIAVAWNGLDGMPNPFTAEAGDPGTLRQNIEVAITLMAQELKSKVLPELEALRDPKDEIRAAIGKHGEGLGRALAKQVMHKAEKQVRNVYEGKVLGILTQVNGPFRALMEVLAASDIPPETPEASVASQLTGINREFKGIRNNLIETRKGK